MRPAFTTITGALIVAIAAGTAHGVLTAAPPVPLVALHGVERAADRTRTRIRDTLEAAETLPMMAEILCPPVRPPDDSPDRPEAPNCRPLRAALGPIEEP